MDVTTSIYVDYTVIVYVYQVTLTLGALPVNQILALLMVAEVMSRHM